MHAYIDTYIHVCIDRFQPLAHLVEGVLWTLFGHWTWKQHMVLTTYCISSKYKLDSGVNIHEYPYFQEKHKVNVAFQHYLWPWQLIGQFRRSTCP